MHRWKLGLSVAGLLVVIASVPMMGFSSPGQIDKKMPYAPSLMGEFTGNTGMRAATEKRFSVNPKEGHDANLTLKGNLLKKTGDKYKEFNGTLVLHTSGGAFPIKFDGPQELEEKTLSTGRTVIFGTFRGLIKTRGEEQESRVMFSQDVNTGATTASLTAGVVGDASVLFFGEQFLSAAEIEEMIGQKKQ